MTALVLVVVLIVAVAVGFAWIAARRRAAVPVASRPDGDVDEGVVSEPVPISRGDAVRAPDDRSQDAAHPAGVRQVDGNHRDDGNPSVVEVAPRAHTPAHAADAPAPPVRWTKQFEPHAGALSDEARMRLINDLGMLRAPWCVPLLVQAGEEETDPALRLAAQLALARCRDEHALEPPGLL